MKDARIRRKLLLVAVGITALCGRVAAGDGKYDAAARKFNFGVSIRFSATPAQLDKLESEFQKASALLYDATDGQQQFGEVVVCNDSMGGHAAEVWVLESGRSNAPGHFGVDDQHIVLYYSDVIATSSKADGSWVVAHEWGHHAYYAKDEYSGPGHADGLKCITTPSNPNDQTACLMENFWIHGADGASLTEFCVESNHDPNADTFQESINGEACWTTLHEIYADVSVPALPLAGPVAGAGAIVWTELVPENRFVPVIDRSGSMFGQPIALAINAAKQFVFLTRPEDKLAVVSFSTSAVTNFPMSLMSPAAKATANAAIDAMVASGSTNIGGGMTTAKNVITGEGARACQQVIVLLSDGAHNTGTPPASVIPSLVANGIIAHTIALGGGADIGLMQTIATQTGGKFFQTDTPAGLGPIFVQLAAEVSEGGILNLETGTLAPAATEEIDFDVDSGTQAASFIASWDGQPEDVELTLVAPDGTAIAEDAQLQGISFLKTGSSAIFIVSSPALVAGTWALELADTQGAGGDPLAFQAQALTDSSAVTLATASDKLAYTYPEPMFVTAMTSFGAPLTGVSVTGSVKRPNGTVVPLLLFDDGSVASGDEVKGDGIYTGRFSAWSSSGGYQVRVDVENDGSASVIPGESIHPSPQDETQPPPFTRQTQFSVTAANVPLLEGNALAVDSLKIKLSDTDPAKSSLKLKGRVDLSPDELDPLLDPLAISIGSAAYVFAPADLIQVGSKPRYVFKDPAELVSGFVDLFQKGSSLGKFSLKDKGLAFGALDSFPVAFAWGLMNESITVAPVVSSNNQAGSFGGSAGNYLTNGLFVLAGKVKADPSKPGKDKLSLRALVQGNLDAASLVTSISFGSYAVQVHPLDWVVKNDRLSFTDTSNGKVTIVYDSEDGELSLKGSGMSLAGFVNPVIVEVAAGTFDERREITMAVKGTSLSY